MIYEINKKGVPCRDFIRNTGLSSIGFTIVPGNITGNKFGYVSPKDKLNIAGIGIGGKGRIDFLNMAELSN